MTATTPSSVGSGQAELAAVLLQLLRAAAPPQAFRALVDDAVRAGTDERQLATLRSAVRLALEVRELLVARERRERELAALYETAGDLSSLRELQPVLQAIVGRAHALIGSDATYLMLNDDDRGLTHMRVTQGIRTDAFKNVELTLGAGLGGLVAATGQPYATADYAADPRFVHIIDDVVAEEGLVAIAGVPLKLGDRVIGVLFAANRRPSPVGVQEMALLGSLAAHAAIAIETASLFDDVRRAVAELREANTVIQAKSEAVERSAAMHERLTGLVVGGGGLADVAQTLVEGLAVPLLMLDAEGRVLAAVGGPMPAGLRPVVAAGLVPDEDPLRELVRGGGEARASRVVLRDGTRSVAVPVRAGSERLGVLVAAGRPLDDMDVRSLERAALVTALLLLHERSVADAEGRVRGELFDDLLNHPERDEAGLRRRAARLGVLLDTPHVVVVVRPVDEERRTVVTATARQVVAAEGGLAGDHGQHVVLLIPGRDSNATAALVGRRLAAGTPVTVGAAGPAAGARAVAATYREAVRCVDVLTSLGRTGQVATPEDLGVYGVLLGTGTRADLERFVRRTVGPVLDYDARRGSTLAKTLLTYFQLDGNLARTAAELYVHVNTLYQRLDRVTALLGDGWRRGDQALQVHLALKVHAALLPASEPPQG